MAEHEGDPLSDLAKKKGGKGKGQWTDLSVIGRKGKVKDYDVSETEGLPPVNTNGDAGEANSNSGFPKGKVGSWTPEE